MEQAVMYKCIFCGRDNTHFNCDCVETNKGIWDKWERKKEDEQI